LIEINAHDKSHGGYLDVLERDWSPASGTMVKRMNTHIHLMEAMTTFLAFTHEPRARDRLIELIFVNSNSVVRKDSGACTDRYLQDWQLIQGAEGDRVSYGHDVENIWLLVEACGAVGIATSLLLDLFRKLFEYALHHGFDWRNGGFYASGPLNAPADRREKVWWVQAEGLVAALQMYRLTGETVYWNCFLQTLDWIVKHQVDWEHGDWHERVAPDGTPTGMKAGPWKSAYHNGRAMLECLKLGASA
jgi:mannobiose 2-epimerase